MIIDKLGYEERPRKGPSEEVSVAWYVYIAWFFAGAFLAASAP